MKYKRIHFVGVKGVGMTPLAIIAKEAGCTVTGSDIADTFITDTILAKAGIHPLVGFAKEHINGADLVITTSAHGGFDNVEVHAAKEKGIPVMSQGEAVGSFMNGKIFPKQFTGISVAGSHGKTTTTAMLTKILKDGKLDPSYVIGTSDVGGMLPGHFGKGSFFVAEADEYATEPAFDRTPKFLWQHPKIAIVTNIEFDHPDMYPAFEDVVAAFRQFVKAISRDGTLIANGDDHVLKKLLSEVDCDVLTFGISPENDYVIKRVSIQYPKTFFWLGTADVDFGEFSLDIPGEHNARNAAGAVVAALACGVPIEMIKKSLAGYMGSKRRFEEKGRLPTGAMLFDDYAHHPTEIKTTLQALRKSFSRSKIVCIFQPHMYSRTKKLFDQFITSFSDADTVILTDIYPSLREAPDPTVSSKLLTQHLSQVHKNVVYEPTLPDVVKYVQEQTYGKDTIIVTMGAGDIYKIAEQLVG